MQDTVLNALRITLFILKHRPKKSPEVLLTLSSHCANENGEAPRE